MKNILISDLFKEKSSLLITRKTKELLSKSPKRVLTGKEFITKIKKQKCRLICVGDMVSLTAINGNRIPDLSIFDGKTERDKINVEKIYRTYKRSIIKVKNPQGTITNELYLTLLKTINAGRHAIKVDGEEDLATLLCVFLSKNGNLIAYGIPKKGVALLKVSSKKRTEALGIIKRMKVS
jgi:uncharacterized protein (UPF0218 family)